VVDKEIKKGESATSGQQTLDTRLSDPIVQALSKWVFPPSQFNGQPWR